MRNGRHYTRKERIREAFSGADDYDRYAVVQRRAAERLAAQIAAVAAPDAKICEIGCGTGFLGLALGRRLPGASWLATDLSPAMVRRAAAALGADPRFRFAVVDAEHPGPLADHAPFDLICSSFAAQWFSDIQEVLAKLAPFLKPGGRMLIATLAEASFAEWRRVHADLGLSPGVPDYPSLEALGALRVDRLEARVEADRDVERFASGRDFLASLRAIGAGTPRRGHVPLSASDLRRALRRFEAQGCAVTYEVATLQLQAADA